MIKLYEINLSLVSPESKSLALEQELIKVEIELSKYTIKGNHLSLGILGKDFYNLLSNLKVNGSFKLISEYDDPNVTNPLPKGRFYATFATNESIDAVYKDTLGLVLDNELDPNQGYFIGSAGVMFDGPGVIKVKLI